MRRHRPHGTLAGVNAMGEHGLIRPRHGRVVAGVCAGLGLRLGMGPWLTRLLFLLVNTVIPGSFLIVYVVLWVLMPSEESGWTPWAPRT